MRAGRVFIAGTVVGLSLGCPQQQVVRRPGSVDTVAIVDTVIHHDTIVVLTGTARSDTIFVPDTTEPVFSAAAHTPAFTEADLRAALRERDAWLSSLDDAGQRVRLVPTMDGDDAWMTLASPMGSADDPLFREVVAKPLRLGGVVIDEDRHVDRRGAAPGCSGIKPVIIYDPTFVLSLTSTSMAFIREHERAHFTLEHLKCLPSGPVFAYVPGAEREADCLAVREILSNYAQWKDAILHSIGQSFWQVNKPATGYYESSQSRSMYIRRECT